MVFHRKQKKVGEVNVAIDSTVIERIQSFNFLGIMLNEALSWKNHIAMVSNKISKVIRILYQLKYVFPESVLFTFYNSLLVSYINYGLLLWGDDCHKLETLQKKALRFMTNSSYVAHTAPLLIWHGVLSVTHMYKLKLLKFYYKLSYDLLPPYFNICNVILSHLGKNLLVICGQHYIRPPLVKRVYAECSPLIQLIKLINIVKQDENDTILRKNHGKDSFV